MAGRSIPFTSIGHLLLQDFNVGPLGDNSYQREHYLKGYLVLNMNAYEFFWKVAFN